MFELHWYPGHMAQAVRTTRELMRLADAVLEVADARIPFTSRHPNLPASGRPIVRVLLLSRADLAEPGVTRAWIRRFRREGLVALAADLRRDDWTAQARKLLSASVNRARPWAARQEIRVVVVGLPNVGKSTAINRLIGKAKARTGGRPGVTRRPGWISAGGRLLFLDTPGVLWPQITRGKPALYLAATGCVPDEVFDVQAAGRALWEELAARFPERLKARYGLWDEAGGERGLEVVARRTGCLGRYGEPDEARAAAILLNDFRTGRLGPFSLERPPKEQPSTEGG